MGSKICEVEVIATGNELLFGRFVDTNSAWIAKQVTEHGGRVRRMTCVGDDTEDIERVVREGIAQGRDFIITTGGLGPSRDDITIESIAKAVGRKVSLNEEALEALRRKVEEFLGDMEGEKKMAFLVEGSEPLGNPIGYAPGMKLRVGRSMILALPGIPKEMRVIFKRSVIPLIDEAAKRRTMSKRLLVKTGWNGLLEAQRAIRKEFPHIYFKTYSQPPTQAQRRRRLTGELETIRMDLLVEGESLDSCRTTMERVAEKFRRLVEEKGGTVVEEET